MSNTINLLSKLPPSPFKRLEKTKIIFKSGVIIFTTFLTLIGYNDITQKYQDKNTTSPDRVRHHNSLLSFLTNPVYASSEENIWECHGNEANDTVKKLFNDTWCDGYKRWLWEAAGFNASCGGEESSLKKDGCQEQIPNGCPQGQSPCSEDYSVNCTCADGSSSTKICHKRGCSVGGVPGPTCSWSEGSFCEECNCGPIQPPPTPPTPPSCPMSTKNCVSCHKDEEYCRYEEGEEYGYLGWACQNNNPGNIRYSQYRIDLILQMDGYAPCGEKGTFMTFSTYDQGKESVKAYIKAINAGLHKDYPECGNCTFLYFFARYADNPFYAHRIADRMGGDVTVDTKLNWVVENRLEDFFAAIQYSEGFFTQEGRL